eukprot:scaffold9278_cov117-Isochrysis_galbana.AAC.6
MTSSSSSYDAYGSSEATSRSRAALSSCRHACCARMDWVAPPLSKVSIPCSLAEVCKADRLRIVASDSLPLPRTPICSTASALCATSSSFRAAAIPGRRHIWACRLGSAASIASTIAGTPTRLDEAGPALSDDAGLAPSGSSCGVEETFMGEPFRCIGNCWFT